MDSTDISSLLWGLIGTLAFLVLAQLYYLLTDAYIDTPLVAGVGIVVGVVTALFAHALRPRLQQLVHICSLE
jgi:putative flippase GtrA